MSLNTRTARITALLCLGLLTSCGGGGKTSVVPPVNDPVPAEPVVPAPAPNPAPDPTPVDVPTPTRDVSGLVLTTDRLPIPGAELAIDGAASATTDPEGRFQLTQLPVTEVVLALSAPGYQSLTRTLPAGGDLTAVEVTLEPAPIEDLGPVALFVTPSLGSAQLSIELPGYNLPVEAFIYRRTPGTDYDWSDPVNPVPLSQVQLNESGHANTVVIGQELRYRDTEVSGGQEYRYSVRLRSRAGDFGPPQGDVVIRAAGFGPATSLKGGKDEVLLNATPGADGSLVAMYRDLSYKPWHRFITRRLDGLGNRTEVFRTEGVYDDAQVYVDRFDTPYFLYRRNGIEFLFETFLFNYYDSYGLSPDIHLGESYRKITNELAGDLFFRPDPEKIAPQELAGIYINRDQKVIANLWDFGGAPKEFQVTLGEAQTTLTPYLQTMMNQAGDFATIWNADHNDSAYYRIAFLTGKTVTPDRYLASGTGMQVQLGTTADDQFLVAFTTAPVTSQLTVHRYQAGGAPTGELTIDLSDEGATFLSTKGQWAMAPLPNGRTYLAALVKLPGGQRQLRAWNLSDFTEVEALGPIRFSLDAPVPTSMDIRLDTQGKVHLLATEDGDLVYRRLFWPGQD